MDKQVAKDKPKTMFKRVELKEIEPFQGVKVERMKHIVYALSMVNTSTVLGKFKKLSKTEILDLETGEIIECRVSENRSQNIVSLKRSQSRMRKLINNNFDGAPNELMITVSYAENMTDTVRLYNDSENFIKKMRRHYGRIEYLTAVEPQERGAWHCHTLMKFLDHDKIFLDNNTQVAPLWGHGWTKTKALKGIDNIGAYLTAYLCDVEVQGQDDVVDLDGNELVWDAIQAATPRFEYIEDKWCCVCEGTGVNVQLNTVEVEEDGKKVKKRFAKGARLHLYPSGMNLYRASRGIRPPVVERMTGEELKKIVGDIPPNYSRSIVVSSDERAVNTLTYLQYNLKREKSKVKRAKNKSGNKRGDLGGND